MRKEEKDLVCAKRKGGQKEKNARRRPNKGRVGRGPGEMKRPEGKPKRKAKREQTGLQGGRREKKRTPSADHMYGSSNKNQELGKTDKRRDARGKKETWKELEAERTYPAGGKSHEWEEKSKQLGKGGLGDTASTNYKKRIKKETKRNGTSPRRVEPSNSVVTAGNVWGSTQKGGRVITSPGNPKEQKPNEIEEGQKVLPNLWGNSCGEKRGGEKE